MAGFNVLAIRSYEDSPGDTYLYPGLGEQDGQAFAAEPADGDNIKMLPISEVSVLELGRGKVLVKTPIGAAVYVTDCRVVLLSEVQKVGIMGAVVSPLLPPVVGFAGTLVSIATTARAAQVARDHRRGVRREGKVMVGHIRYEWIRRIVVSPSPIKGRWHLGPIVALEYTDGETTKSLRLVHLRRGVEPVVLAQDIVRRAAAFRLRHNLGLAPDQRAILEQLIYADILRPPPEEWAWYNLPASQIPPKASDQVGLTYRESKPGRDAYKAARRAGLSVEESSKASRDALARVKEAKLRESRDSN